MAERARLTRWRRASRLTRLATITAAAAVVAALGSTTAASAYLVADATAATFDDAATIPTRGTALVFGTLVEPDGTPSGRLADRLRAAVDLHRAGRVGHLLMTGDHRRAGYDEVGAMRAWAIAAGVPGGDISTDGAGLDTYDSCLRARTVFGVHDAVLVTQAYHLPRALYLCRHHGIDAVGLAVADWRHHPERSGTDYPRAMQASYTVREWLARVNATVEARVLRRGPAVPGPYEGLRPT